METKIKIKGMVCENCAVHVQEYLRKIKGVRIVKVDVASATAVLVSKNVPTDNDINKALEESGYSYDGRA
jgi:copper chaperone CopZ